MSTQVQCPNCGGYRVETKTELIDLKGGTKVEFGCMFWFLMLTGISGIIMGTLALYNRIFASPIDDDWQLICIYLPGGLLLTIVGIAMIMSYFKGNMIEQYYHTCWLCGYKWSRRAGEPLPEVTLRPDLIAAGEQRLEESRQAEIAHHAAQGILNRKP